MVYVITEGYYSDMGLVGYFDNLEDAEQYKLHHNKRELEIFSLNDINFEYEKIGYHRTWRFHWDLEKDTILINDIPKISEEYEPSVFKARYTPWNKRVCIQINVSCHEKEVALEVAQDKVLKFKNILKIDCLDDKKLAVEKFNELFAK